MAADPVPRSRAERLLECERRLQENLRVERQANDAYEHHRATGVIRDGRRFGARPNPYGGCPFFCVGGVGVVSWGSGLRSGS
jgi:hypothetical protein